MNTEMKKRALAARDAHIALLDLKRVVDEATQITHAAELEAFHLAVSPKTSGDITIEVRAVLRTLDSADFEASLSKARENLQIALS